MEFIKLNEGWNADPNAPCPNIEISNSILKLSFFMNCFVFDNFDKDDLGILTFQDCFQYRIGPPNDEGFFVYGQDRYQQYGVKWGEFYLVKDSDWKMNFPDPVYLGHCLNEEGLNHYLFYFRDETFECVAKNYDFVVCRRR